MMAFDQTQRDADAALLAAYAAGDGDAARALLDAHGPRVFALARRMLGSDAEAEDVAQEAMLRLWRIAPEWRAGEAQVSTWLYRVVSNLCTDRLRRTRPAPLPEGYDAPDPAASVAEQMQTRARGSALQSALDSLPERQRLAVVLRHLEERGNAEIAEIMDLTVEAVESLQARGRRALKAALAGQAAELSYKDG